MIRQVIYGGTNLTAIATGSVLVANAVNTISALSSTTNLTSLVNNSGTVTWNATTGTGNSVLAGSPTITTALTIQGNTASDLPTYAGEFLDADNWTLGLKWTGSWTAGFTHSASGTATLYHDHSAVVSANYRVSYTITNRTAGSITIAFGGNSKANISATGAQYWVATTTDYLVVTPTSTFNGTVVLSIMPVSAISNPLVYLKDSNSTTRIEIRANAVAGNIFIGNDAGTYAAAANMYNLGIGMNALKANVNGLYNLALGYNTLAALTTGGQNTAVGVSSMPSLTTATFNVGLGYSTLAQVTSGGYNTAIGAYSLYLLSTGTNNSGFGYNTLRNTNTGSYNIALAGNALYTNTVGSYNVGIGDSTLYYSITSFYNVAIGYRGLYTNTTGSGNVAIGANALYDVVPTYKAITSFADYSGTVAGTVLATSATHGRTTGDSLIITGTTNYNGTYTVTVVDINTFYFTATWVATETGYWTLATAMSSYNTAIGHNTGRGITTGSYNTIIGAQVTGLTAGLTNNIILANGGGNVKAQHDNTNWTLTGGCKVTAGFGCNGTTVQTAYSTAGALTAYATGSFGLDSDAHMSALYTLVQDMRSALVANGILT